MFRPAQHFLNRQLAEPPLPLLITGASGVVGFDAVEYFSRRYPGRVIAIRQQDNVRLSGPAIVACDAEDRRGLEALFDRYGIRSVLNCAGNCG